MTGRVLVGQDGLAGRLVVLVSLLILAGAAQRRRRGRVGVASSVWLLRACSSASE
jgi:hypothetical protein